MRTDKGAAKAATGAFTRPLILIADDHADTREMYTLHLAMLGYMVAVSGDGREAVKKARELRPDLIVMDLDMPDIDKGIVIDAWVRVALVGIDLVDGIAQPT